MAPESALRLAPRLIRKDGHRWAFHAALVVRGGKIIATGHNTVSKHAEVSALSSCWPSERRGTKVYSIRISKQGEFRMARPCPNCMKYLKEHGVKTVYYTGDDGILHRERI